MPPICVLRRDGSVCHLGMIPPGTPVSVLSSLHADHEPREDAPLSYFVRRGGLLLRVVGPRDVDRLHGGDVLLPLPTAAVDAALAGTPMLRAVPCGAAVATVDPAALAAPPSAAPRVALAALREATARGAEGAASLWDEVRAHGHFFVEVPAEVFERMDAEGRVGMMERVFGAPMEVKEEVEMEGWNRIWGWKAVDFKRKECFKVRDCEDLRKRWPSEHFPPLDDVMDVFDTMYAVGKVCAIALLQSIGVDDEAIESMLRKGPALNPVLDRAASFYEMFKYDTFSEEKYRGLAVCPCEEHSDVGLVTVSMSATGANHPGLQLYSWKSGAWVSSEPCTSVKTNSTRTCVVLLGEHLETISAGQYVACPHRVVVAGGSSNLPRYSQIAEVLPHPEAEVPILSTSKSSAIRTLRSHEIFQRNSTDVSSVNFE